MLQRWLSLAPSDPPLPPQPFPAENVCHSGMQGQEAGWRLGCERIRSEACRGHWQKDEFFNTCRGSYPQVLRKRGGLKEQPLEADGLGTHGYTGCLGQCFFPSRAFSLVSEADRLLISVVASQRMSNLSGAQCAVPGAGKAECHGG